MSDEIAFQTSKYNLEILLFSIIQLNNFDTELRRITQTNEDIVTTVVSNDLIILLFNMMGLDRFPERLDEAYDLIYKETNENMSKILFRNLMNLILKKENN